MELIASALLVFATASTPSLDELRAIDVAPASLMSGPQHRVQPEIVVGGYMASFGLVTEEGALRADSVELLAIRVEEATAMATLREVTRTEVYAKAARDAASKTARAVANVVTQPQETLEALPRGIGRLFGNLAESGRRAVQRVSDEATEAARETGDEQARIGPQTATMVDTPPPPTADRTTEERVAEGAEYAARGYALNRVGYGKTRREWAAKLGVDPYTSNPLLAARLDELAWAAVGGRLTVRVGLGAIDGFASTVISQSQKLNRIVWEKSPEDVSRINEQAFKKARLYGPASRDFLRNGAFSPTLQTALTDALIALPVAVGKIKMLELAGRVRTELEARFLIQSLYLLTEVANERPLYQLQLTDLALVAEARDGSLVVPMPVDYLSSGPALRRFLERDRFAGQQVVLYVAGLVSQRARMLIDQRGFELWTGYRYDGGPAYAIHAD